MTMEGSSFPRHILLLRHGEVRNHDGDVGVTAAGLGYAREVGRRLATTVRIPIRVLTGNTKRAKETASAIAEGATATGVRVVGPIEAVALRNPDVYLAGERVELVSTMASLLEQLSDGGAAVVDPGFYQQFLDADDRIGWWLRHADPPGDDAAAVAERVQRFAVSIADRRTDEVVVAVTHSPVLRAVAVQRLGVDIGEPPWASGLLAEYASTGDLRWTVLPPEHIGPDSPMLRRISSDG